MSTTYFHAQLPARPATTVRGATMARLLSAIQAWHQALQERHEARRRVRDAQWVRKLADSVQASDPGMASDLRCAVDRFL